MVELGSKGCYLLCGEVAHLVGILVGFAIRRESSEPWSGVCPGPVARVMMAAAVVEVEIKAVINPPWLTAAERSLARSPAHTLAADSTSSPALTATASNERPLSHAWSSSLVP